MAKYRDVPMSFADACSVRMSEILPDPVGFYDRCRFVFIDGSSGRRCRA
jgi:hypothetical protein